jgi:hypothetical protein
MFFLFAVSFLIAVINLLTWWAMGELNRLVTRHDI